ncbi:MAG TPA: hypothetical protein VFH63_11125 [candidate division Zixibacteria bacterium]|nr:hypothetical protein [candidate division Zixibacteria bacterium]
MSALEVLGPGRATPQVGEPQVEGRLIEVEVPMRFGATTLRLRRMAGRWLASAPAPDGELQLAADGSPYLAAALALEPWQVDTSRVMTLMSSALRA